MTTLALIMASIPLLFSDSLKTRDLHELDVVASKQRSTLTEEAVSSTIIGQTTLENINAGAIKSFSDIVPNVYIPDYGSRITSSIYVRGIGARMDQPAVGLTVDNVPFLNKNAFDFDVADYASVEMLRGPQSILYGRNTMAGLINITTISPMRWQGWRFIAQSARGNEWKFSSGWYHKFTTDFATSLVANFSSTGGFYLNSYNGKKVDKEKSGGIRWKSNWRITPELYLQNTFSSSLLRQGGYPYQSVETSDICYNDTCFYRRTLINDGLCIRLRKPKYTLSSITSFQFLNDNMTLDQDFLPLSYFTLSQKQREHSLTEDIYFKGSCQNEKYKWLTGVFAFYKNLNMHAPVTFLDDGIRHLIETHRNNSNPDYPISWNSRSFLLNSDFEMPVMGVALYHESTYAVSDFTFTGGVRVEYEDSRLKYHSFCNTGYSIWNVTGGVSELYRNVKIGIDDTGRLKRHYFDWMPKFSILWNCRSIGGNVYLNVSKGYKSGGFNTQMFSDVLQQRLMHIMGIGYRYDVDKIVGYKPEYSWNYEVGTHFGFFEDKLLGDATLFFIDCRNQQLTVFPEGNTTGRMMTNAGKTRSFGGELSMSGKPYNWLQLMGSIGYTNARFVEYHNGISDYKGKLLPYVPNLTGFLQTVFTKHCNNSILDGISLSVNLRATGRIFWNEDNTLRQSPYSLLGANLDFNFGSFDVQFWGRNITGSKYDTFYFKSMGNEFVQRGRPWQIGTTIRFNING